GRQYTPVLSRTTCVAPGVSSQSRRVQQLGGSRPEGPHVLSPVTVRAADSNADRDVPLVDMHPAPPTRTHSLATPRRRVDRAHAGASTSRGSQVRGGLYRLCVQVRIIAPR